MTATRILPTIRVTATVIHISLSQKSSLTATRMQPISRCTNYLLASCVPFIKYLIIACTQITYIYIYLFIYLNGTSPITICIFIIKARKLFHVQLFFIIRIY
jgi:hypothetical protein